MFWKRFLFWGFALSFMLYSFYFPFGHEISAEEEVNYNESEIDSENNIDIDNTKIDNILMNDESEEVLEVFNLQTIDDAQRVKEVAEKYIGTPRSEMDCSAFVQNVYADLDISIPRVTYDQADCGERIYSRYEGDLKSGDILCMGDSDMSQDIEHVGIYLGDDVILHSSQSKGEVARASLKNWTDPNGYGAEYRYAVRVFEN